MRRLFLLAALVGAAVLAASWYFTGSEPSEPEEALRIAVYELGEPAQVAQPASRRRSVTSLGLQTTVPDTLGYEERTATYALEDGGFRVRVMHRKVSDSSQDGVVVQQLPRGNLTRRLGWIVTIVVGRLG